MLDEPTLSNLTNDSLRHPPETQNTILQQLGAPHISSFNYMASEGLEQIVRNLEPVEFQLNNDRISLKITEVTLCNPVLPLGTIGCKTNCIYPSECRQRAITYRGKLIARIEWSINGVGQAAFQKDMGDIPIMLKSNLCNLAMLSPKQLVECGEHEQEWGGYFVIKGHERLIRMLMMTRRNYPLTIRRPVWKMRGALFSEYGVSIRCVAEDQTATTNVLHFVTDGSAKLMFSYRKILYYVPLIFVLKCLCDYTDLFIYESLVAGYEDDSYYVDSIVNMLRNLHVENQHSHEDCKNYLGKMFRVRFKECPDWYTDSQLGEFVLKKCVLIHLDKPKDKFNLLVFMTQKLFVFAQEKCRIEGADAVMMQEILLGGHLYLQIIKDKLQYWLGILKLNLLKRGSLVNQTDILTAAKRSGDLENSMQNFLATGNVHSQTGLGLMQDKGLTIAAENINRMRFMSHFRAVHRGAFFQEMRTTEARQLLPDAWGFICPVHTPDGAPCGLLNHLTMNCIVTDVPDKEKLENIPVLLVKLGMVPINNLFKMNFKQNYCVQLDGKIIGSIPEKMANNFVSKLRMFKVANEKIPNYLEIVLVPFQKYVCQFPGLFLFTGPARMMRPVYNLKLKDIEYIGTFEQVYLDICVTKEEFYPDVTTHIELSKRDFLSNLAQLIPLPDYNQSPRNMYQCQMGKQTMGTPCHNWNLQAETKLYRLQTPASPLFRPVHYDNINLDDFAMGTNAIVAVISYTGYDMEDAMVMNKSSIERGFAHGSIYKSEFHELEHVNSYFCRDPTKPTLVDYMDTDGLPFIGRQIKYDEPLYCYYNADESRYLVKKFHGKEDSVIDSVKVIGNTDKSNKTVCFTFRIPRNPCVGDKFASRAGQKGICSQKWATEDLPFTQTGLVPDIIFNPHGFPSRMTIAMMIEIMAGKSAALHGLVHDATPFKFDEDNTAIDYFAKLLENAGYDYYGTETMYSGIDGRELTARIFFGIVHYQRLRHMVSDKWQVRSNGPIDILTRQPLKGRKKGGGVRFGEMERDALISHGTSFLLQDRLFYNSDKTTVNICTSCGTILGPITFMSKILEKHRAIQTFKTQHCRLCGHGKNVSTIEIPYIFKFFVTQLASCNINVTMKCDTV